MNPEEPPQEESVILKHNNDYNAAKFRIHQKVMSSKLPPSQAIKLLKSMKCYYPELE